MKEKKASKVPKGKFITTLKIGEKGQIVIPKAARDLFGLEPGDTIVLAADIKKGIALVKDEKLMAFAESVFNSNNTDDEESQ